VLQLSNLKTKNKIMEEEEEMKSNEKSIFRKNYIGSE
jgi:hypothetical protein